MNSFYAPSLCLVAPNGLRYWLAGGRDEIKLREQDSVRAWKMLENAAESHPSSARFVRRFPSSRDEEKRIKPLKN